MNDIHEAMAASELASLAAFARAVLARAVADNPSVRNLTVAAAIEGGEIEINGVLLGADEEALGGFAL
jgi:hypothetical protein